MLPWLDDAAPVELADVRDTSLAKLVRDEVRRLILSGDLVAGSRINEPEVAARLQISRVPVREALRELESSGLVASRKNFGSFVRVLAASEVAELYELRGALDGHAARRAAGLSPTRRAALEKKLSAQIREMKKCIANRDPQTYYVCNLRFHWMLIEAAANKQLEQTYRGLIQQLHLYRLQNLSHDLGMQASTKEHVQILAALSDGDANRCRTLAEAHVGASHVRLVNRCAMEESAERS